MGDHVREGSVHAAGAITIVGITLARSIHYITSLFMVAYLTPLVIGEFAIAMFIMLAVFSLLTTGTESRIVAMENDQTFLSESWTLELFRGGLTFCIMIFIYVLALFNNGLTAVHGYILILGLSIFIKCGKNINMVICRKNLNMLPVFYVELGAAVCLFLTSVILVILFKSGWALAIGYLAGSIAFTALSFKTLPSDGSELSLNFSRFRAIFSYSKWIIFSAQIVSFFENVVPLFVSHLFGATTLGLFEKSDLYSRKFIGQLNQVFWIVGLPWASRGSKQNRDFYELISFLLFSFVVLAVPALVFVSVLVPQILVFIGGPSWSGSQDIVHALCVVSFIACFTTPFGIVMQAIKLPKISFWAGLVKLFVFLALFIISDQDNIVEFIYALAWANLIALFYYLVACFLSIDKGIGILIKNVLFLCLPFLLFYFFGYERVIDIDVYYKITFGVLFFVFNLLFCFYFVSVRSKLLLVLPNIFREMRSRLKI